MDCGVEALVEVHQSAPRDNGIKMWLERRHGELDVIFGSVEKVSDSCSWREDIGCCVAAIANGFFDHFYTTGFFELLFDGVKTRSSDNGGDGCIYTSTTTSFISLISKNASLSALMSTTATSFLKKCM